MFVRISNLVLRRPRLVLHPAGRANWSTRQAWRRLERRALRGHDRDLHFHLRELAAGRPVVLGTDASWTSGVVSLQLPGHRLVLGGVKVSPAREVVGSEHSLAPLTLRKSGRYGPYWWVAIGGEAEQVILARHLQLIHDPGQSQRTELDLPVLSGAS